MSESFREPQLVPADHCYTIIQDHGPNDGGWGPAAIALPEFGLGPQPFVYTGSAPHVLETATAACRRIAQDTGKPTRFVRFTQREDLAVFGGSS